MQVLMLATFNETSSIRDQIIRDDELSSYGFYVKSSKKKQRNPGWAKLASLTGDRFGAINIEWDNGINLLTCRIVTRDLNSPWPIIGEFTTYLLERYEDVVETVNIYPR